MPTRLSILGIRVPETVLRPRIALPLAGILIFALVCLEWYFDLDVSLGIFYILPIAISAIVLNRWQILILAIICAYLRGLFTPQHTALESALRFVMAVIAYSGAGLLVVEMSRNRRIVISHYASLKMEQELRRRAEEQLRVLAESSPAAILTVDHNGDVIAANRAAHEIFGFVSPNSLIGHYFGAFVPTLGSALKLPVSLSHVRTSASAWARRVDGTMFPIATWFSIYGEGSNRRLAAIVVDVSEEVRDREMENFRHVLDYNRLLAGAVSHEIRNLCSAVAVVSSNLGRRADLAEDEDFQALNQLVSGLSKLASFDLARTASSPKSTSLTAALDNLHIVIETDWKEIDGTIHWKFQDDLSEVQGDTHGLLQIFLNLAQNSLRAVSDAEIRELTIEATTDSETATISFVDSGPGVASPEDLFQPFRSGSDGSGLGLYISRELARSFSGDLTHVPQASGCRFDVTLKIIRRQPDGSNSPTTKQTDSLIYRG